MTSILCQEAGFLERYLLLFANILYYKISSWEFFKRFLLAWIFMRWRLSPIVDLNLQLDLKDVLLC